MAEAGRAGVVFELLAQAVSLHGKFPHALPFFGVVRRGAPVPAFPRLDDRPTRARTSRTTHDIVVVLEAGLIQRRPVTDDLRPGGFLLVTMP